MTTIASTIVRSGKSPLIAGKGLYLNRYTPNLRDPRTQKRVQSVLDWCESLLLNKHARSINHKTLRKVFGNTGRGLGRWLYSNLLIQTGSYAAGSYSFSYLLNSPGYEKLHGLLGQDVPTSASVACAAYADIISGTEIPQYVDHGGRRFHPIQNLKKKDRKIIFEGWWDYDIDACVQTLVYQYALAAYFAANGHAVASPFPAVARLIESKNEMREHIAAVTKLSVDKAKELIQLLFFRAMLSPHSESSMYRLMNEDRLCYERFKNDSFVKAFRADARRVWMWAIQRDKSERAAATFADGIARPHPKKVTQHRNAIYIMLERKVMNAIEDWFPNGVLPGILMHDGFMSMQDIPVEVLERHVKETTGYNIKLKKTLLIPEIECVAQEDGRILN